ncbi:MAG: cellulose binding domain-containing protein [Clostridiales bacterium]|nr:cellulose binding domain-containing protein [Clostridiales bacterium]
MIETVVTSTWENHTNIELRIKNNGIEPIENWFLTFKTPYVIENIWNSTIVEIGENGVYTIRNNNYNQDIEINSEVSVGITLYHYGVEYCRLSDWYLLNTEIKEVDRNKFSVTYQEYSRWDSGFCGALVVSTQETIEDWCISFESEYDITDVANASILLHEDNRYEISNDGYMQNIDKGIYSISIQGIPTESDFNLSNVSMTSIGLAVSLTEDSDNDGILDYCDYLDLQYYNDPVTTSPTPIVSVIPTEVDAPTEEVTVVPTLGEEVDKQLDSDKDGLPDYYEIEIGTKIDNWDSDCDLVGDYNEVLVGYDPTKPDSDDDGILDGDEDYDDDRLINSEEETYGTYIYSPDSDFDDLSDYDELYCYYTDPMLYDSDGDDICDGDEIYLGKDPRDCSDVQEKVLQSVSETINNEEDQFLKKIDVIMELSGRIDYSLQIEDVYGKDEFLTNISSRIGSPISFECDEEFEKAEVAFYYDEKLLGETNEEDLILLWCNEDTGVFVEQEQAVIDKENNKIVVELSHFSIYMIVDGKKWYAPIVFPDYKYEFNESADLDLFISLEDIDDLSVDERIKVLNVACELIDNASDNDRVGVIITHSNGIGDPYSSYFMTLAQTTFQKSLLKNYIEENYVNNSSEHLGNDSYINNAIAYSTLVSQNSGDIGNTKRIVQITNGNAEHYFNPLFSNQTYLNREKDVPFYVVNISEDNHENDEWLIEWCATSKGSYSFISEYDIEKLVSEIRTNTDRSYDKDNDGLPDYLESQGMVCLNYDELIVTDCSNQDLDRDGILDGYSTDEDALSDREEMGILYEIQRCDNDDIKIYCNGKIIKTFSGYINDYEYKAFVKYIPTERGKTNQVFYIYSNPTFKDSDYDEVLDDCDAYPLTKNKEINYIFFGLESGDSNECITPLVKRYEREFRKNHMSFISVEINGWNKLVSSWQGLASIMSDGCINEKMCYCKVNNLIIVSHGAVTGIAFNADDGMHYNDISALAQCQKIPIDYIDIQACYSAYVDDTMPGSMPRLFVEECDVKCVLGWTGMSAYIEDKDENMGFVSKNDIVEKHLLYSDYIACYWDNGVLKEKCLTSFARYVLYTGYEFCLPSMNDDLKG